MLEAPFDIVEPQSGETPVLVEVPHAGLWLDAEAASYNLAPTRCIARDADLYVDELFADSPSLGATFLFTRLSRYVVDLNREADDIDGASVRGAPVRDRPRGVMWRLTSDGLPILREPLPEREYRRRIDCFHAPYHRAIQQILERKRQRFGLALMLCAHSMPSPRRFGPSSTPRLADLVPGTRGRTSADARFIDRVDRVGKDRGYRVQHDIPYRGGFSTTHYGRPKDGVHAIQLEIARRPYMDEETLGRRDGDFERVRELARDMVSSLVEEATAAARAGLDREASLEPSADRS